MIQHYNLIHNLVRGLHILAVIAWMAGLLYLPRLFVYHTRATAGSEMDETFKVMEVKLLRMIINPAMFAVVIFGGVLVWLDWRVMGAHFFAAPWFGVKMAGVAALFAWHGFLAGARRAFAQNRNRRSERFWRMSNEIPFLVAIVIVLAATIKFGA